MESIANAIGNTPMLRIDYRYLGARACIYAKLESYNLTGSIKDRMVAYVLEAARARGDLRPGQPIAEVTSGNTGISLSAIGGSLGHPVHIFMPDWVSAERVALMEMYGATLHLVSREAGGFLQALALCEAFAVQEGAYRPDQFNNPDNVLAHYYGTGAEILRALPDVDGFVAGVGSGGTLMGVARRLRESRPVTIAAVEPDAAPMLSRGKVFGPHCIEGIGDDFVPGVVNVAAIDKIYPINDRDAVNMARRLALELGVGVGISSGANFLGGVLLRESADARTVATTFADDNKKYISTTLRRPEETRGDFLSNRIELIGCERV